MQQRTLRKLFSRFGMLLVLTLAGCVDRNGAAIAGETVELRAYAVGADQSREIADVLQHVLGAEAESGPALGRVAGIGGNRLLVAAPAAIHDQIEELIDELGPNIGHDSAQRIRFNYWLVTVHPGGQPSSNPQLDAIQPALGAVVEDIGPAAFELIDQAQVVFRSGAGASLRGTEVGGFVEAAVRDERIAIELNLNRHSGPAQLQTVADMVNGELLTLGMMGGRDTDGAPLLQAYIIRVDLI